MDIVIINLTHANMVYQTLTTIAHATAMVAQKKTRSYAEQKPCNDFIPLTIETYECLYFISIHFLSLVHKPQLHVIDNFL